MGTWSPELVITLITSLAGTMISCGVVYGIMKTQIENLKESHANLLVTLSAIDSKYVTKEHFEAVISPVKDAIREMRADIKEILVIVSHKTKSDD